MRRSRVLGRSLRWAAIELLIVALSPLIVVAGEWPRRYAITRLSGMRGPRFWRRLLMRVVTDRLWIALTAPARAVLSRTAGLGLGRRRRRGGGPLEAGVREPRRPRPSLPGAAVALAEPPAARVSARLLGMTWLRSHRPGRV